MNNFYDELVYRREQTVDGVKSWLWIKEDEGAWKGPSTDWPEFKKLHLKYCKKFQTVVQAGGALGMYPRLLSDYFDHVYSFEPDHLNFFCAVNNCQKPNIHLMNAALGSFPLLTALKEYSRKNSGMHSIEPSAEGFIPTFTIDDLALRSCDLIMLDVEGYESEVLQGAEATINRFKPLIQTELARAQVSEFMEAHNYEQIERCKQDIFWLPKS